MKYFNFTFPILLILCVFLTSCTLKFPFKFEEESIVEEVIETEDLSNKIVISTTLSPVYNWVKAIVGDDFPHISIHLLQSESSDIHSYRPDADDLLALSESDYFIYVDDGSENWIDFTIKSIDNSDVKIINLLELLDETKLNQKHYINHSSENSESNEYNEHLYDEHIWLSLNNAIIFVDLLTDEFTKIDKDNVKTFNDNASLYIEKLENLDRQFRYALAHSEKDTIILADRSPFTYFFEEYNINCYSPTSYCDENTTFDDESITYLANKLVETQSKAIFILDDSPTEYAEKVINQSNLNNIEIFEINPMQDTSAHSSSINQDYLTTMRQNLANLLQALN